jgi:epoxyqueuosine reductase
VDFLRETLNRAAHEQGFVLAGFARLRPLADHEDFYNRWLADGGNASMTYLAREPERRFDPRRLDPRYKSVVSLGYPYAARATPNLDWRAEMRGRIAAYALGRDYHDVVKKRARAVGNIIRQLRPGSITRTYVDTGPVFEREWASASRIGWFGKNTMILNRDHGSYFFLAEIFTDVEFDVPIDPYREHCGTCRRCLDLCPTGALADGYVMRSDLCISYQTIENRGAIPRDLRSKLGNWIFGCDICNDVCPWNDQHASGDGRASDDVENRLPRLPELLALTEEEFGLRFTVSAVKRAKRRGLLRNVAVALGNTRNPDAVAPLARSIETETEPLIRSHAAWALGEIGGNAARRSLERALRDRDTAVRREATAALEIN